MHNCLCLFSYDEDTFFFSSQEVCVKASDHILDNMIAYTSLILFGYTVLLFKERHKELRVQWPLTFLQLQ